LKSRRFKREIKHLCSRLVSIAAACKRPAFPAALTEKAARAMTTGDASSRYPTGPSAVRSSGAYAVFTRMILSLPLAAAKNQAVPAAGFLAFILDEKIVERGARQRKVKPSALFPRRRRVEKFRKKPGLDGPRPILNLARDDLDRQLQFC